MQRQRQRRHAAGGEQHGIEIAQQARHRIRSVLADAFAEAQLDAEAQRVVQFDLEDVAGQPERRNAIAQHAAGVFLAFEQADVVAEHRKIVGGRDAGRPGADDGDALAGGGVELFRDAVAGILHVGRRALQVADRDRLAVSGPAVAAGLLAGARTDAAEHAGQDIGLAVDLVGVAVSAFGNGANVGGYVGPGGTGVLAGDVPGDPADVAGVIRKGHGAAIDGTGRGLFEIEDGRHFNSLWCLGGRITQAY